MVWSQVYNPTGNAFVSTLLAAIPVIVLLGGLGIFHIRAHIAAIAGLAAALVLAIFVFQMPASMAGQAALFGGSFALIGICWIIFNLIFLYRMTVVTRSLLGHSRQALLEEALSLVIEVSDADRGAIFIRNEAGELESVAQQARRGR